MTSIQVDDGTAKAIAAIATARQIDRRAVGVRQRTAFRYLAEEEAR